MWHMTHADASHACTCLLGRDHAMHRLLDEADHLIEAVHLVGGADAESRALVDSGDGHIQDGAAGHAIRRLAAGLLDQEAEGRGLEGEAQLGRGALGGGVREDALALGELLVHVRHQATSVAQGELVIHVVVKQLLVALHLLGGAHVGRGEDLAVGADLDVEAAADPGGKGAIRQLAALGGAPVAELVHSVIQADQHGGARAVQGHEGGDLVATGGAQEAIGAGARLAAPDANHGAHSPIVVHNGRAVQRVPAHGVLAVGVAGLHLRLLLRGAIGNDLAVLASLPHDVVSNYVHGQLGVTEGVGGALNSHQGRAEGLSDVGASVQHLLDDIADHGVGALAVQHGVEVIILVLLLRGGVERRAAGAVLAKHTHIAHGRYALGLAKGSLASRLGGAHDRRADRLASGAGLGGHDGSGQGRGGLADNGLHLVEGVNRVGYRWLRGQRGK
mmetsp:Transcript_920/g.2132  ORF Transcript_920/g.2132 Transcript_920/m.2132 type:complete len:446 (+) Transcript_920:94-1431(+)